MTLTAPIPIAPLTLAELIRVGIHPVRHEARFVPTITFTPTDKGHTVVVNVDSDRLRDQLRAAQASVVLAIGRTLDSVNVPRDAGRIDWEISRDDREWTLTGIWRPTPTRQNTLPAEGA